MTNSNPVLTVYGRENITITLTTIDAATLDNMLTVCLSQLASTDASSEYRKSLERICEAIQKELGVNKNDV